MIQDVVMLKTILKKLLRNPSFGPYRNYFMEKNCGPNQTWAEIGKLGQVCWPTTAAMDQPLQQYFHCCSGSQAVTNPNIN